MLLIVQTFVNEQYNANTYLLTDRSNDRDCYLVDIGTADGVLEVLQSHQKIKGIFLTHAHYDHICGIHEVITKFPHCKIYCSQYTKEALADAKINLSFYHNTPITYSGNNIEIVKEHDKIKIFEQLLLEVIATPGHNTGSLSFRINQAIFTGDSLIPEAAIVTKLKSGNKVEAKESVLKLKAICNFQTIIYPGHGKPINAVEVDWDFYL